MQCDYHVEFLTVKPDGT